MERALFAMLDPAAAEQAGTDLVHATMAAWIALQAKSYAVWARMVSFHCHDLPASLVYPDGALIVAIPLVQRAFWAFHPAFIVQFHVKKAKKRKKGRQGGDEEDEYVFDAEGWIRAMRVPVSAISSDVVRHLALHALAMKDDTRYAAVAAAALAHLVSKREVRLLQAAGAFLLNDSEFLATFAKTRPHKERALLRLLTVGPTHTDGIPETWGCTKLDFVAAYESLPAEKRAGVRDAVLSYCARRHVLDVVVGIGPSDDPDDFDDD